MKDSRNRLGLTPGQVRCAWLQGLLICAYAAIVAGFVYIVGIYPTQDPKPLFESVTLHRDPSISGIFIATIAIAFGIGRIYSVALLPIIAFVIGNSVLGECGLTENECTSALWMAYSLALVPAAFFGWGAAWLIALRRRSKERAEPTIEFNEP